MDMLREEIVSLCKDFIEIANRLYENEQITHEQYVNMTKLKLEYIDHMKKFEKSDN